MRVRAEETGRRSVTIGRNGRMGGHLRTMEQVVVGKGRGEKEEPPLLFLVSGNKQLGGSFHSSNEKRARK